MTALYLLVLLAALPPSSSQSTKSFAYYTTPMTGHGTADNATIKVWTPPGSGKFPVFMWIMGTFDKFDNTAPYASNVYDNFTEYMASKGYIAGIPNYANQDMCMYICADTVCQKSLTSVIGQPSGDQSKMSQTEKNRGFTKALDVLCALPQADCSLGVAVAGHSQGAYSTVQLATIDSRVTAINPWSYGYLDITQKETVSCVTNTAVDPHISKQKRRMVVGRFDDLCSKDQDLDMKGPQDFSSYACTTGPHSPINCIQPDGSGYYVISKTEYTAEDKEVTPPDNLAGHPFFNTKDPVGFYTKLVPSFASGSKPWHMKPMLDWLAGAARVNTTVLV